MNKPDRLARAAARLRTFRRVERPSPYETVTREWNDGDAVVTSTTIRPGVKVTIREGERDVVRITWFEITGPAAEALTVGAVPGEPLHLVVSHDVIKLPGGGIQNRAVIMALVDDWDDQRLKRTARKLKAAEEEYSAAKAAKAESDHELAKLTQGPEDHDEDQ